ncbi:MAG: hypothetical protein RSA27_06610, partial [Oscillospiraceae bacterium]
ELLDELIEAFKATDNACDEVWFASSYGYPKLDFIEKDAKLMLDASKKLRSAGIKTSLQISNTIGHGEYIKNRDCSGLVYKDSLVENLVGYDGTVAKYSFCYNGKNFKEYIYKVVREYSKFLPDCVWVDDDLRALHHSPIVIGCFCDDCIKSFNKENDSSFSREELVKAVNYGDIKWRKAYSEFVKKSLANFAKLITDAVMSVSKDSRMGYQYSTSDYTGKGVDYIFDAFKEASGKVPNARPGGGHYNDYSPYGMIDKAMYLQYQNSMTPSYVLERCAEVENTPDVAFGKTIYGTCIESSVALACGCNSLSYATLMREYEPISWHQRMFEMFKQHKPYWQQMIDHNKNATNGGICVYTSDNAYLRKADKEFSWIEAGFNNGIEMLRCGIPFNYYFESSNCVALFANTIDWIPDADIKKLMERPVILDALALEKLIKRGFKFDVEVEDYYSYDSMEVFSNHEINGANAGRVWENSPFFGDPPSNKILINKTKDFEIIGEFKNSKTNKIDGIANGILKTSKGAKWAVFSYGVWNSVLSFEKRNQILNSADYICDNKLPAILKSPEQVAVFPMVDKNGKTVSVSLVNCSIGKTDKLSITIRNPIGEKFFTANPFEESKEVSASLKKDGYSLEISGLDGWHITTIFIK